MPPKLVRITIDVTLAFAQKLEYGEVVDRTITEEELEELDTLDGELMAYSDFATADALEDEKRRELMKKKKRYEELKAIEHGKSTVEWKEEDLDVLSTLLVMMRPGRPAIYVENIPPELLEKMLDPNLTVNITGAPPIQTPGAKVYDALQYEPKPEEEPQPKDEQVFMVEEAIRRIGVNPTMSQNKGEPWLATKTGDGYHGLIYVSRDYPGAGQTSIAGVVYAWPVKFMKDDWAPANTQLKTVFESKLDWTRDGKFSHWSVKF